MSERKDKKATSLKFKFLPCTNYKPARVKVTQTNNGKSCTYCAPTVIDYSQVIEGILNQLSFDWIQIIDNTQNDYYQYVMLDGLNEIPDYIGKIREITRHIS